LALFFGVIVNARCGETPGQQPSQERTTQYVGSASCSRCHGAIYRSFAQPVIKRPVQAQAASFDGPNPAVSPSVTTSCHVVGSAVPLSQARAWMVVGLVPWN